MKKAVLFFLCLWLVPVSAHAQGAAPEMFGINEVVIEYARFDDPDAAETCGLSRDEIAGVLIKTLVGSAVPAVAVVDAKPVAVGTARIQLIPEVSSYVDEGLGCVSWVSLTAQNHAKVVIMPINTLRSITAVYWQQHVKVGSGQSVHGQKVDEAIQKMAQKFLQQYKLDQPPEIQQ
ncbi:MAG: hypothetical protein WCD70_09530 [Alphaproteobacteria bacterium]